MKRIADSSHRRRRGLSLQEMLVVVAVFVGLMLILTFSSNTVILKSRMSRVKQEQQMLSGALEAYRAEFQRYPSLLSRLVDPFEFVEELPVDPFVKTHRQPYTYYCLSTDPAARGQAIIVSAGPDGDIDFFPPEWSEIIPLGTTSGQPGSGGGLSPMMRAIVERTYDPTNGIASDGDVIKLTLN